MLIALLYMPLITGNCCRFLFKNPGKYASEFVIHGTQFGPNSQISSVSTSILNVKIYTEGIHLFTFSRADYRAQKTVLSEKHIDFSIFQHIVFLKSDI